MEAAYNLIVNAVFIYGPPGAGKLTVATRLAALTGYRLFDNHTRFDFAQRLFDFGTEPFWQLESRLSHLILEAAITGNASIITTFVAPTPAVMSFLEPYLARMAATGGKPCFIELTCEQTTLEARLQAPGRAEQGKLTQVEVLRRLLAATDFSLTHPTHTSLRIDNTLLNPDGTALRIANQYGLVRTEN